MQKSESHQTLHVQEAPADTMGQIPFNDHEEKEHSSEAGSTLTM